MSTDTIEIEQFVIGENPLEVVVTRKDKSREFKVTVMHQGGDPFVFTAENGQRATKAIYVSYETQLDSKLSSGLPALAGAIQAAKGEVERYLTGGQIG